jgi:hypothetical protein
MCSSPLQPRVTLIDSHARGCMVNNGGSKEDYPHHVDRLTIWNFEHAGGRNWGRTYADSYWMWDSPWRMSVMDVPLLRVILTP